jgi:hypothetical protein
MQGQHPPLETGREHANYNDYHLDVKEMIRIVRQAASYVREQANLEKKDEL